MQCSDVLPAIQSSAETAHPAAELSMNTLRKALVLFSVSVLCVGMGVLSPSTGVGFGDESEKLSDTQEAALSAGKQVKNTGDAVTVHPANRLARESSPYLLMHAHNPIDWYPWGPEAFERARTENKPVFLSIGYSSCYWCHVMERQVFMNQKIADYMKAHFVCIKVDREERPDIDDIYMTSLIVYQQAAGSGGGGGWPLSMFLTPQGEPIAGATYLPPEDTPDGRTGFLTAANRIHDVWTNNQESASSSATMIAREVRRLSGPTVLAESTELKPELLDAVMANIAAHYDTVYGGVDFNPRKPDGPRFPSVPRLLFLLSRREAEPEPMKIADHSLTAMAKGGIRDHLGGGFHRYSTDREWIVPHFEKMLYDQAQLLEAYAQAAQKSQNPLYLQVINELVGFIEREMTLPDGGFCSALDAETHAIEGEYYVWSEAEIRAILKDTDAELFLSSYGCKEPQSFEHGLVLFLPKVTDLSTLTDGQQKQLTEMRTLLLEARSMRPRPLLDDKVLTEWNALMIQGLATSGRLPGRGHDLDLATKAADFLLTRMKDSDGHLLRSWRNGTAGPRAYLDDYACLISALRALHESTKEARWMAVAMELQTQQIELFFDEGQGAFFFTAHDHEKLFARSCSPYDSVSPSGNSITIRNLLALSREPGNPRFRELAEITLKRFSGTLESSPAACSGMAMALQDLLAMQAATPPTNAARRPVPSPPGQGERLSLRRHVELPALADRPDEGVPLSSPLSAILTSYSAFQSDEPTVDEPATDASQQSFKPVLSDPATPSPFKRNYEERPVKAKIYPYFDKLERGGKCPVAIELTIAKEWHINANPASPEFLIPTEITVKSDQKVKMTKVKYPEHELLKVEGQTESSHVYGDKVMIYALLEIDAGETAEKAELEVEIKFQACNSRTCEPPDAIKLKGKLTLASPGDEIMRINESKFPKDDATDGEGEPEKPKDGASKSQER